MSQKYGRLSAKESNALGYLPAKVLLNGEPINECVLFDDNEGWVEVNKMDEDGNHVLHYDYDGNPDGIVTEVLYGEVTYLPNQG